MKPRRVDQLLRALQFVHRPPQNNLLDRAARDESDDGHRFGLAEAVHARRRLSSVKKNRWGSRNRASMQIRKHAKKQVDVHNVRKYEE